MFYGIWEKKKKKKKKVSVCVFFFGRINLYFVKYIIGFGSHLPITRKPSRDQYRISIRGVSGLALEESNMHTFSRI